MLKFLTHKLRTHSLNEEHPHQKVEDDDHDSGTESDDEHGGSEELENSMESECCSDSMSGPGLAQCVTPLTPTPASPYCLDSALPSDSDLNYDHHSSEEELEVINSSHSQQHTQQILRSRSASTVPEKRKWSQVTGGVSRSGAVSSSSDEEVQGLLATVSPPVQFHTSPPRHAHHPRPGHRSLSPPPKLFHYTPNPAASPRKRHRHTQRPCLDFEKMQQLKARAVTAWRHSGDHGGELSVFCW